MSRIIMDFNSVASEEYILTERDEEKRFSISDCGKGGQGHPFLSLVLYFPFGYQTLSVKFSNRIYRKLLARSWVT